MRFIYTAPRKKEKYIPYYHLYVLLCEHGKFYVGISRNVQKRLEWHKSGKGAEWTKIHKPIRLISDKQLPYCSYEKVKPFEDGTTIKLMKKHGRENVRGGIYCAVDQATVDSFLGEDLCRKIPLTTVHKAKEKDIAQAKDTTTKKNNDTTKKSKTAIRKEKRKLRGYVGENTALHEFKVRSFGVNHKKNTRNLTSMKLLIDNVGPVRVMADHQNKVIWVPDTIMKKHGDAIMARIKQSIPQNPDPGYGPKEGPKE